MGVYCYVGLVLILPLNAILFYFLCYQISCIMPVNAVKTKNLCSALCCARFFFFFVNAVMPGGLFNNAKPLNPLIPLLFNSQLLTARSIHTRPIHARNSPFLERSRNERLYLCHPNNIIQPRASIRRRTPRLQTPPQPRIRATGLFACRPRVQPICSSFAAIYFTKSVT
jgi:hypothetical protein